MSEISFLDWDIGAHTSFSASIFKTLTDSISHGMTSTQFFMGNPKSFKRHRATKDDIDKSLVLCDRFPINVFTHFPYISNLAGSVQTLAWNGDEDQDKKTSEILKELEYELKIISNFRGNKTYNGVVIHPGNFKDRKLGIKTIAKSINKINFTEGSKLILENSAGGGCSLATTFEEIKEIYDQIDAEKQQYIGVCVDTAHICGYGLYDLSNTTGVDKLFSDFDSIIGLNKFCLLHLNDSHVCLGSKKDRHAWLSTGCIWGKDTSSLVYLLDTCKKNNIPAILETCVEDMLFLSRLKK